MRRCPECDTEHPEELDACPACGTLGAAAECEAHPGREAVGCCVACGRPVCRRCRAADGRAVRCREHADVVVIEGWAQVYSTTREFEAQLVGENLRAEGVDAHVFSQRDQMFALDLGELSIVRVLVPVWEYEQARQVIREHMDAEGEVAFACPACGEAAEPGAGTCPACGAALE